MPEDRTPARGRDRVSPGMAPNPGGGLFEIPDEPWVDDALCAETDPEAFFPEKGGSTREGKRICGLCAVSGECLTYALEHGERYGIWGGLSERERRRLQEGRAA